MMMTWFKKKMMNGISHLMLEISGRYTAKDKVVCVCVVSLCVCACVCDVSYCASVYACACPCLTCVSGMCVHACMCVQDRGPLLNSTLFFESKSLT